MKQYIHHIIVAAALIISGIASISVPQNAMATSVMALTDEQLVSMSDIIIHATIEKTEAIQYDDHTILTQVTVNVHEVFKGDAPEGTFTFYTRGGVIGDYTQTIPGEFEASEGSEVVVFLEKIRRYDDKPMVLGLKQGAFIIQGMPMTRTDHRPAQRIHRQVQMPGESEFLKASDTDQLRTMILRHL